MSNYQEEKAALYYKDIRSDKVYNLHLQQCETGWSVLASWGRRGTTLQADAKVERAEYEAAKKIYDSVLRQKLAKGYQPAVEAGVKKQPKSELVNHRPESKQIEFAPELLTRISDNEVMPYVKSPRYMVQIKRDGRRLTVVLRDGEIFGYNKLGQRVQLDDRLHTILTSLFARKKITSAVIDGEWEATGFWAWDVLELNHDTRGLSYGDRFDLLREVFRNVHAMLHVVDSADTEQEKASLILRAKKNRAEGVAIKDRHARFLPGRNGQHLKYKFEITGSFIVGPKPDKKKNDGHRSVAVYLFDKGRKRFMGTVKVADRYDVPADGSIVEVRYLYCWPGAEGRIYQPVYFGTVRDDVRAEDCTVQQLKMRQEDEEAP